MAISSNRITEIMNGYISCIENSGKIYWNEGIIPDKDNWGLTKSSCGTTCTSNEFSGGKQCNGFARFIAYLLTGTKLGNVYAEDHDKDVGGGWIKKSILEGYVFCPGDIVEVNDGANEHSAVVLSANGDNVQFLELWSSWGCKVAHGGYNGGSIWDPLHPYVDEYKISMTATNLRLYASHIIKCPPIEEGDYVVPPETPPCNPDAEDTETPTPTPEPEPEPEVETVKVSFYDDLEKNGGKLIGTRTYTVGSAYGSFPTPDARTGYTFDKWYTATGGYVETWSPATSGRTKLYAHWTAKPFTVTCRKNNGTNV